MRGVNSAIILLTLGFLTILFFNIKVAELLDAATLNNEKNKLDPIVFSTGIIPKSLGSGIGLIAILLTIKDFKVKKIKSIVIVLFALALIVMSFYPLYLSLLTNNTKVIFNN